MAESSAARPTDRLHHYRTTVRWTGNLGEGTREYRGYRRDHSIEVTGKAPILGTSGLSPRSDPTRHSPEDLLVGALAACHMLWYLHLCSEAGVVVVEYRDDAEGTLAVRPDGSGRIVQATLRPHVRISAGSAESARALHEAAHSKCFVASSVNFPVRVEPEVDVEPSPARPPGRRSGTGAPV